jgi:ABC-type transport system involved in multi-copper enzyme maturation permease subunit
VTTAADTARRRRQTGLVGPLFRWELIRLARRGQTARARFILAATLLLVLTLFTVAWFPSSDPAELFFGTGQVLTLDESAHFAEQFALTFLLAQLGVLVLLTPAYAAGGISEEKEKHTFVYLLVSDLTSREILCGKFLGRLAFLLAVMLAGLPVLALTQLYGGVSLPFLLMGYLVTAATVAMHAAISAAAAAATDTYRGALFRGYGLAALHALVGCGCHPVLSPFAIIAILFASEANAPGWFLFVGLGYSAVELAVAVGAVLLGVRWVRQMRSKVRDPRDRPRRAEAPPRFRPRRRAEAPVALDDADVLLEPEPGEPAPAAKPLPVAAKARATAVARPAPARPRRRPLLDPAPDRPRVYENAPLLWKERYTTGTQRTADDDSIRGTLVAVGVGVGVVVLFFVLLSLMTVVILGNQTGRAVAERLLLTGGGGGLFAYLLVVGTTAAGSVVRERQRQTLESLFTLPVGRRAILWPKWQVSVSRGWWWGVPAAASLPLAFLVSDTPLVVVPAVLFLAAAVPFVASYGVWLSIRCKTMSRAVLWLLPAIGGLTLALPVALLTASDAREEAVATAAILWAAGGVAVGAWFFWYFGVAALERDGRN